MASYLVVFRETVAVLMKVVQSTHFRQIAEGFNVKNCANNSNHCAVDGERPGLFPLTLHIKMYARLTTCCSLKPNAYAFHMSRRPYHVR